MKCEITIANDKQSSITLAMKKKPSIPEWYLSEKNTPMLQMSVHTFTLDAEVELVTMEVLCVGSAAENRLLLVIACEDYLSRSRKKNEIIKSG